LTPRAPGGALRYDGTSGVGRRYGTPSPASNGRRPLADWRAQLESRQTSVVPRRRRIATGRFSSRPASDPAEVRASSSEGVWPADRPADPIFIVGPARSGTSLLYKTLCLHPDAGWVSNWVARFPGLIPLAALNRVAHVMPGRASRVWFAGGANAYVYGKPRRLTDRLFPMPVEGEPVYRAAGAGAAGAADAASHDRAGERLRRVFGRIRAFGGGSVLVSKRIGNNQRIPFLARAFPTARFVEVVRDGRAVAYSLSRVDWWADCVVPWYGGTPSDWQAEGRDPWELCARHWLEEMEAIRTGLRVVSEERILRVRYETLVSDPLTTLGAIAAFIGLPADERWTTSLRALAFPDRNEAWQKQMETSAVDLITSVQRKQLEALGYLEGSAEGSQAW
jgi:Sulfotransferase family